MEISDLYGSKFLFIDRPCKCVHCCCPPCCQSMTVECPRGQAIGYISQQCALCRPKFEVQSSSGEQVFLIQGPCFILPKCCKTDFKITSPDGGAKVGKISKQWSGLAKEIFTDTDNFGVEFPIDISPEIKATILAAVFLIDFMYFEDAPADG
ncbi:phospholipid scramblase [Elysia marginata]|uniref:Phospholipid scramblase n=1 Tax=Elysia marginata TaxID=1093978 RepID=A0AAV4HRP6_9GAST|nr:phospholipid scramblase [Elysia marginata]